jgi:hypothetical protein
MMRKDLVDDSPLQTDPFAVDDPHTPVSHPHGIVKERKDHRADLPRSERVQVDRIEPREIRRLLMELNCLGRLRNGLLRERGTLPERTRCLESGQQTRQERDQDLTPVRFVSIPADAGKAAPELPARPRGFERQAVSRPAARR